MTLRARIAVTAAVAVAVAVLSTSVGAYVATARTLHAGTDRELRQIADDLLRAPRRAIEQFRPGPREGRFGGPGGFVQLVRPDGRTLGAGNVTLPVTDRTRRLAATPGSEQPYFESTETEGVPVRILNVPIELGVVQVALPTSDTAEALATLRRRLVFGSFIGIAIAAGLGLVVARRAVRPVHDLTELAEDVAETGDLTRRIDVAGDDEIGRLARTFNGMLANLEEARAAQQQLVADASHELRTPLTSLRTNIEVLEDAERLHDDERRALIGDVVDQLDEFGRLVDGLVALARGAQPARAAVPVRLDDVVEAVVERLRTFARDREFVLETEPTTVVAESDRLDRAVANLIDNAIKYGRGPIEVTVRAGEVRIRDHGGGIDEQDLPHVFERFYRSPGARSAPGSGLGLSIVDQVARSHGGRVVVENAEGGGAAFTLRLPQVSDEREFASTQV